MGVFLCSQVAEMLPCDQENKFGSAEVIHIENTF